MNEVILFITAIVSALFVCLGWKLGKERLYSVIIVFLILIASVGGKVAIFFGHQTNTGNIFYASVFLATYFLIERFGRREGIYSIWVGVVAVTFFTLSVQITIALSGSEVTAPLNVALTAAYGPSLRIAFASLIAYMFSQNLNVHLYLYLKKRLEGRYLWLRANISSFMSELLDSAVFFTIAFWGVITSPNIWDVMVTGLAIKTIYMMFASPLLYLNGVEEEKQENGEIAFTVRLR